MSQQTPIARVLPVWQRWMERWPTPADLAAEPAGEAVRMWDRLGYPRRALRLWESAVVIVERHGGEVPREHADLLALPGVGAYTAAAVASFAFGDPRTVVDTNVRRVLARTVLGQQHAAPSLTVAETRLAERSMPTDVDAANTWNVAVMELGALVCTARSPRCEDCPVATECAWQLAGRPEHEGPPRRGQPWHGTDRQVRGRIVQLLRESADPLPRAALARTWPDDEAKVERCLAALIEDGLVEQGADGSYSLPS
jgi:A/G-specific adenine glycosylase